MISGQPGIGIAALLSELIEDFLVSLNHKILMISSSRL